MEAPEVPGASYGKGLEASATRTYLPPKECGVRLSNQAIDIHIRPQHRPRSGKHRCRASEVMGSRLAFASKVREGTGYSKQQDGRGQIIRHHGTESAATSGEASRARTVV